MGLISDSSRETSNEVSPVTLAVKKVFEALQIDSGKDPRLAKAMVCFNPKEIAKAVQTLQNDPALPVLVVLPNGIEKELIQNAELGVLLQYPNVRVADVLTFIPTAFEAFKKSKQESLGEVDEQGAMERALGTIRHDLGHALNGHSGYDKEKLLEKARQKLGFEGNDETLVKRVMEPRAAVEVKEYRNVAGVFVDWDGTLKKDSGFDAEAFAHAKEVSEKKGLPLVVWTGGEPDSVYRELVALKIEGVNVCSKQDCKGFRVAVAIDDEPLESLKNTYGIDAKEFEKVAS